MADVAQRLERFYPKTRVEIVTEPPAAPDFAINATPCGLNPGDPLSFDPARLPGATLVCDIIMKPKDTRLLQAAQARGLRIHHGHHMLDAQIPMYLEFFGMAFPDERTVIDISSQA